MLVRRLMEWADAQPDRPWIEFEQQRVVWTYGAGVDQVRAWATRLNQLGVRPGDRVGLLLDNSPEFVGALFGSSMLGAAIVPINTALRGVSLSHVIGDADLALLVTQSDYERAIQEASRGLAGELPRLLTVGPITDPSSSDFSRGQPVDLVDREGRHPFAVMYTSGTTGPSKGSLWNHGTAMNWAETTARHMRYVSDDVVYTCLPLFHANAMATALFPVTVAGAKLHVAEKFSVSGYWSSVTAAGATSTNLLGVMAERLLSAAEHPQERSHQLTRVLISPCPADIYHGLKDRFGVQPVEAYGLSDFGMLTWSDVDGNSPPGSCGRSVPDFEVKIVDPDDNEVEPGVTGECIARPRLPWITPDGYHNNPTATIASRTNLWFHTGDRMYRDVHGYFYFVERTTDSIRRRGENISAHEVEVVGIRFEGIRQIAAYAVDIEGGEQEVAIAVVIDPEAPFDPVALLRHMWQELPFYAVPRFVRVVDELPQSQTQKVLKYQLRADGVEGAWDRDCAGLRIDRSGFFLSMSAPEVDR